MANDISLLNFNKYLEDEESIQNLQSLNSDYNQKNIVPFVGAGTSHPTGEPLWEELLDKLVKTFNVKEEMPRKENGDFDFPASFSAVRNKCDKSESFFSKVFEIVSPITTYSTYCHSALFKAFETLITTNFDDCLDKAYQLVNDGRFPPSNIFCCANIKHNFKGVVYIHGHKSINYAILCQEDYDNFYPSISKKPGVPVLETFIDHIFRNKHLLFVGFSFDDNFVSQYLALLQAKYRSKSLHYAFISTSRFIKNEKEKKEIEVMKSDFRDYLSGMGIRTIFYTQHVFIDQFIESLWAPPLIEPAIGDYPGVTR